MGKQASKTVVWDLPLRVFHWLLAASVVTAFIAVKAGNMYVHEKAGITVAALLAFRLVWGFAGSRHSRFRQFVTGPGEVLAYIHRRLGGDRSYHPGHAPTGGWATVLMLAVLAGMAGLGTMAQDDVLYEGPLAALAGEFSETATNLHHMGENLVIAVVVLHLLAILLYRRWFGIDLAPRMFHGGEDISAEAGAGDPAASNIGGLALMAALLALAHGLGMLGDRFY